MNDSALWGITLVESGFGCVFQKRERFNSFLPPMDCHESWLAGSTFFLQKGCAALCPRYALADRIKSANSKGNPKVQLCP